MEELVVLVDEKNNVVGTAPKATVHTTDTPLHRAFSVFLFNPHGEFLVTRRAVSKKTFPGVWTNSFCGHVLPEEKVENAAMRRLRHELGISHMHIESVHPYRYRFADLNGIVENEICPILIATTEELVIKPSKSEVMTWKWVPWNEFFTDIQMNPDIYSPWSREEALIVAKNMHLLKQV